MADKVFESKPMTTDAAREALGRSVIGRGVVPSGENKRPVENLAVGLAGKRENERIVRRVKMTLKGNIYFIDDIQVSKERYFGETE